MKLLGALVIGILFGVCVYYLATPEKPTYSRNAVNRSYIPDPARRRSTRSWFETRCAAWNASSIIIHTPDASRDVKPHPKSTNILLTDKCIVIDVGWAPHANADHVQFMQAWNETPKPEMTRPLLYKTCQTIIAHFADFVRVEPADVVVRWRYHSSVGLYRNGQSIAETWGDDGDGTDVAAAFDAFGPAVQIGIPSEVPPEQ